jgi:transcription initiation factor TFIID subunit 10
MSTAQSTEPQGDSSTVQLNGQSDNPSVNETSGQAPPATLVNGTSHPAQAGDEAQMPDMNQLYQARRDEEAARRDRSLAEFLVMLDGYKPLVS